MSSRRFLSGVVGTATSLLPLSAGVAALLSPGRKMSVTAIICLVVGAVMWVAPVIDDGYSTFAVETAQTFLIVLSAFLSARRIDRHAFVIGVLVGLVALIAFAPIGHVGQRASGWSAHPNIWAGMVILPALLAASLAGRQAVSALAVVLGMAAVLLTGSRGQLAAIVAGGLVLVLARYAGRRRRQLILVILCGVALLAASAPRTRALIQDSLTTVSRSDPGQVNLVQGGGDALHVDRLSAAGTKEATILAKTSRVPWARLQYPLILQPGSSYSISVDIRAEDHNTRPGLWGTGRDPVTREDLVVTFHREGSRWSTVARGPIEILSWSAEAQGDDWWHLHLAVRSASSSPVWWYVGPTPDQTEGNVGAAIEVRDLRFLMGSEVSTVVATRPSLATVQALARRSAFIAAWNGFVDSPLTGQGKGEFASFYRENPPGQDVAVPSHAHNWLLHALFERGAIGAAGLVLLLGTIALTGLRGSPIFWVLIVGLAVSNLFDNVLFSSGQVFVFAAGSALLARDPRRITPTEAEIAGASK